MSETELSDPSGDENFTIRDSDTEIGHPSIEEDVIEDKDSYNNSDNNFSEKRKPVSSFRNNHR